jgi:transposase
MSTVAILSSKFRLSRRELPKVLADFFGLSISVGSIQKLCERSSDVMTGPVEQIAAVVQRAPVVNADETSFPHRAKKNWLWVATCPTATLFRLHRRRGAEGLATLMPDDYNGLLIVDRWKPYEKFNRSFCHAHLLRNWREIGERKHPEAKRIGKWAEAETERLLRYHRQFRTGELSKAALAVRMRMLKARYGKLLDDSITCADKKTSTLGKELNRQWGELWAYLEVDGAEPTSNAGERQMRPAVLWRKGSFSSPHSPVPMRTRRNGKRLSRPWRSSKSTISVLPRKGPCWGASCCTGSTPGLGLSATTPGSSVEPGARAASREHS